MMPVQVLVHPGLLLKVGPGVPVLRYVVLVGKVAEYWRTGKREVNNPNEPRHDKTNNVVVRPAKTQISLGISPVWSESSLSAWRNLAFLATHWAHSEDSDQHARMPRLIWVFVGRTLILLVLSWGGSNKVNAYFEGLTAISTIKHVITDIFKRTYMYILR